ncbi:MAG: MotA/TolQ/ExbB proton channel family protein [Phycisphaeraceae bacterium]|nr:MotA/TolQ/ExbB proton channel family protein [Phycisphaeraceae bacterium]MCB9848326.1 MotA/TolQ/ExbB proton channel family protein [Phycisphaeraceae bacterium]
MTVAPTLFLAQDSAGGGGSSVLQLIAAGGLISLIIVALSFTALTLIVIHLMQVRAQALAPEHAVAALDEALSRGDADSALRYCRDEDNECFLTRIMSAALGRYHRSAFGLLELKSSLEEAGQEEVARLYRSTDWLGLIAAIAPMLGLLGTVVGMVGAFDTISSSEGFARPDQLAGDISKALVTTLMGLTLAIPATAAFTFFRNRIDTITAEIALTIEDLAGKLEKHAVGGAAPLQQPQQQAARTEAAKA